jgi:hypothetical protein
MRKLAGTLVALHLADIGTTWAFLRWDLADESNPVAAAAFDAGHAGWVYSIKLVIAIGIAVLLYRMTRSTRTIPRLAGRWGLITQVAAVGLIVLNNALVIRGAL